MLRKDIIEGNLKTGTYPPKQNSVELSIPPSQYNAIDIFFKNYFSDKIRLPLLILTKIQAPKSCLELRII